MSRGETPYTLPPEKIVPNPSGMEISLFPPIPSIVFSILSRFPAEAKFHLCVGGGTRAWGKGHDHHDGVESLSS